jgi:glucokinase
MPSIAEPTAILAGDVGGTKSYLAICRVEGDRLSLVRSGSFPSREYTTLEAMVLEFLGKGQSVDFACVGVAGPIIGRSSRLTNLMWIVEEELLREACGAKRAWLINDLQATAFGVSFLPPADLETLQEGAVLPHGNIAVLAAGTGLGEAFSIWNGRAYMPIATEGGHVDFPPRDRREFRLLEYLQGQLGRVSAERVVSGPGLYAIYRFLRDAEGMRDEPGIDARISAEDPPRVIVQEGQSGRSETCREALRMFASLYGATAGNAALQIMATGGVYLGGGLSPAVLPSLRDGGFIESFRDKGRFRDVLAAIPVKVILNDRTALLGAAHYARVAAEQGELA